MLTCWLRPHDLQGRLVCNEARWYHALHTCLIACPIIFAIILYTKLGHIVLIQLGKGVLNIFHVWAINSTFGLSSSVRRASSTVATICHNNDSLQAWFKPRGLENWPSRVTPGITWVYSTYQIQVKSPICFTSPSDGEIESQPFAADDVTGHKWCRLCSRTFKIIQDFNKT